MSQIDRSGEESALAILELLAREAPLKEYDELLRRSERAGAEPAELDRLERCRRLALDVHELVARRRSREAELTALVDSARELTQTTDVDAALRLTVRRARLLMKADMAYAACADDAGELLVRAAEGSVSPLTIGFRIPSGSGLSGASGGYRAPFWSSDYLRDRRFKHTDALDEAVRAEGLHAILCAPLRVDGKLVGLLFVANRHVREFTPDEVALTCSFADLAAAAISTARSVEGVRAENHTLRQYGSRMRTDLDEALRATEINGEFVQLALDGIPLDDLLDRAAAELGGTVAVRDPAGELLGRRGRVPLPDDAADLGSEGHDADGCSVPLLLPNGTWVLPLTSGAQQLGSLFFQPDPASTAGGNDGLRPSLPVLARAVSVLLATRRAASGGPERNEDVLGELLALQEGEEPGARAAGLPLVTGRRHVVVVARLEKPAEDQAEAWSAAYARRHHGLASVRDDRVVLLLPGDDPGAWAARVRQDLSTATDVPVTACAAGPARGIDAIHHAHREALRCLAALTTLGGTGRSACARNLGFLGMLLADDHDIAGFIQRVVGPVLEYDAQRFSNLMETLEAYFQSAGSPTRAAEILYVHPNTVSRRMERITQLLGREWQEPERALELQLALRLERTRAALWSDPDDRNARPHP